MNEGDITERFRISAYIQRFLLSRNVVKEYLMESGTSGNKQNNALSRNLSSKMHDFHKTNLGDIFISIKSTFKNHNTRLNVLLDTWVKSAINQTFVFTDADDPDLQNKLLPGHVINTNCSSGHTACRFMLQNGI